ncbi:MAG: CAP domain-containing protein [Bacteroidota bacterium]
MKILLLLFASLLLSGSGDKFLEEIPAYQRDSYFKQEVYNEHDSKSFYQLKEANSIVNPDNYDLHLLNAAVFFATNKLREEKKLKTLLFSSGLRDAAVVHSYQMVTKNFFNHINSKTLKLRMPDERMSMFGAQFKSCAENIDWNNIPVPSNTTYIQLADKLVDAWFHSAPHKKTMLSKQLSHLGCGAVFELKNKNGTRYIKGTQDFILK